MTGRPAAARPALLELLPLVLTAAACSSHFPELAARFGQAEGAAAAQISPLGTLAYRLCRKEAAYEFALDLQNAGPQVPSWPEWYGSRPGPRTGVATMGLKPATWQQYCDQSVRAGDVIHDVARGLSAHGRALAALAEGKPFDASGLQTAADTIGTASAKLGVVGKVPASAHDVGSGFATATQAFVKLYRDGQLERLVYASQGCMERTFADLTKFTDALDERLRHVEEDESTAVRILASRPSPPALDRGVVMIEALEAAGEGDREIREMRRALAAYRTAIDCLAEAHETLADLAARQHPNESAVQTALDKLDASVLALTDLER